MARFRQLLRLLLADPALRRQAMFGSIGAAVLLLAIGAFLAWDALENRPLAFVLFWGVTAWLTVTAMLLAIYDVLLSFRAGRSARRSLERKLLESRRDDETDRR